ncbi:Uncharacterised protein [Mycobacteroides abscessus subsp. abscessus]|nr:Uncharacterised protein [Mycobacteroides abscessus subsp. abscessus]
MTYPPGAVRARALLMKWLWMEKPCGLCAGSTREKLPKGTLPTTAANEAAGTRVVSNPSERICAFGYSAAAMAAVIGSFSTPTITASGGANPMKLPEPQPGSRTRPPVKPAERTASHMAWAMAGSV